MQKRPPDRCLWCGDEATHLCDHAIGRHAPDAEQLNLLAKNPPKGGHTYDTLAPVLTCDAPMCRRHAYAVGHVCRRSGRGKGCDTIDMCEFHTGGLSSRDSRRKLTTAEASAFRRRMAEAVHGGHHVDVEDLYG